MSNTLNSELRANTGIISTIQKALHDPYTNFEILGDLKFTESDLQSLLIQYPGIHSEPFTYAILQCDIIPKLKFPTTVTICSSEFHTTKGVKICFDHLAPVRFELDISTLPDDNDCLIMIRKLAIYYPKLYMKVSCNALIHKIPATPATKATIKIMAMTQPSSNYIPN
jgi:hypothetical protein